jgi:flagellar FliL protein
MGGMAVMLLAALALGAGAGLGYAMTFGAPPPASVGQQQPAASTLPHGPAQAATASGEPPRALEDDNRLKDQVVPIEPVIVSVGGAAGRWLRLEGSVAFSQPVKAGREVIMAQLSEDLMGFLRGTSLSQLESAAGVEFLRDDLTEIVQLRTRGRARRFILRALVIE